MVLIALWTDNIVYRQQSRGPTQWGNLPSPETLVRLDTPQASFVLPMGYLNNWYLFRDQPMVEADDGKRVFSGPFSVHFVYPDGAIETHPMFDTEIDGEQVSRTSDRSVVTIDYAEPPDARGRPPSEVEALALYPPGQLHLEPLIGNPRSGSVYRGVATGPSPGHRVGVIVSCDVNCIMSLYLEHRNLVLRGLMAGRLKDRSLDVAAKTQELFDTWIQTAR